MPTGALPAPASVSVGRPELEVTRGRASRLLEWLAIATLAALLFAFVSEGAPNCPIFDSWVWINHARAFDEGGFAGFWKTRPLVHNQHFYALPSLFAVLFGPLVGYSFRVFAFISAALVFALGLTFSRLSNREGLGAVAGLFVFATVVSARQYENFWWGFQLGLPLCVLSGSWAVIVADARRDRSGLVLASVLSVVSVASSSAGLLAIASVILVRGFAPRLTRLWIVAGIAALLVVVHFGLVALRQPSFVGEFLARITWSKLPLFLEKTARVVGAGLVAGPVALPLGVVLIAGSLVLVVTRIGRAKRIDALVGLTIFSLSTCVVIAVSRDTLASRHAIFATPLIAVCAIGCLQWLRRTGSVRALGYSLLFVAMAFCAWRNLAEAASFRRILRVVALNTEFSIALAAQGAILSPAEIGMLPHEPTEDVRTLIPYLAARGYCGNPGQTFQLERHEELPSLIQGATNVRTETGYLRFAGPGHVYNEFSCSESSGRWIRLSAEVSTVGSARMGIIILRPNGSERTNISVPVIRGGGFAQSVVRSRAGPGDRIQPYVYTSEPDNEVAIKSFQVVLVDAPFDLEPD